MEKATANPSVVTTPTQLGPVLKRLGHLGRQVLSNELVAGLGKPST
jgi:hypothetical protein